MQNTINKLKEDQSQMNAQINSKEDEENVTSKVRFVRNFQRRSVLRRVSILDGMNALPSEIRFN